MKIFFAVGNSKKDFDTRYYPFWIYRDFLQALTEMGHEIVTFEWELPGQHDNSGWNDWYKNFKDIKNKELINQVDKENNKGKIDIFIKASDSRIINRETIKEIKSRHIITVNYHCDDVNAFHLNEKHVNLYDNRSNG